MLRNVFAKTLWDQRRGMVGWSIALAAVTAMYVAFFPSMNNMSMAAAMEAMPAGLSEAMGWTDITSAEGYVQATILGLLGSVLIIIFAIAAGARAIAGEEEKGTLELLIAHPVRRSSVVWQRAAALVVSLLLLAAVTWLALAAMNGPAQLEIPIGNLAAASLQLGLLGFSFGALALAVGSATGRKGVVLATTAAVAVATYILNALSNMQESLQWAQGVSPFSFAWAGDPLRNGIQFGDAGVLLAIGLVLIAVAVFAFDRRDVAV